MRKEAKKTFGTNPILEEVPKYPPKFRDEFVEEWEKVCCRLFKSGKDLSRIIITKGG